MDIYMQMAMKSLFTVADVNKYYGNLSSASSAIRRMILSHKALRIRNNLYTCINVETGMPIANRFQIGSSITATSYISHHTAMEYYGFADQVFYDVYVSSQSRFADFSFDGYRYHYVQSKLTEGIHSPTFSGNIRVTDQERTLVDSLKDMNKISGMEEVLSNIQSMHHLQENKILHYMGLYENQFLYQKAGFILKEFQNTLGLNDDFFEECKKHIGQSKRYLIAEDSSGVYQSEWKLVIPEHWNLIKNGEVFTDAAI